MTPLTPPVKLIIRQTENGMHEILVNGILLWTIATESDLSMRGNNMPQVTITIAGDEINVDTSALGSVYIEPIE